MKKLTILIAAGLMTASVTAQAAPQQARSPMAQALDLTPEQEAKINKIRDTYQAKIKALVEKADKEIRAVLTPEQKKKLAQIEAQRQAMIEQMRQRMQQQQQGAPHGK
ncbi:hypothetical protein SAMN05443662_0324 [Sulfurivirga caldicuralii]|uniref:LTXXQ motif family protein n=1 Tax=Sulfurivirga caldicuralii TaxID=364032 RepID=A0A1N6DPM6_9GAMM|nr:hypothetical protein [Sulfurivirga caldicuralii]SIN72667.1 hypothetical protein SAMN05443662_0324 [Sulfurivirga caldicuralii]